MDKQDQRRVLVSWASSMCRHPFPCRACHAAQRNKNDPIPVQSGEVVNLISELSALRQRRRDAIEAKKPKKPVPGGNVVLFSEAAKRRRRPL